MFLRVQKLEWKRDYLQHLKQKSSIWRCWEIKKDTKNKNELEFKNKWWSKIYLLLQPKQLLNKE